MSKETYHFSHDYEPTADPKMKAMMSVFKGMGYAMFFRFVEMLHSDSTHKLPHKKYIFMALADELGTNVEHVLDFVEQSINVFELFESDGEFFWSNRVFRNIEKRASISESRSKAGKASAEMRKKATSVEQNSTNGNKGKESKVNKKEIESKENPKVKENNLPSILAVEKSTTKRKIEISNDALEFAEEFRKTLPPSQSITEKSMNDWAVTYDEMIRIDNRTKAEIYDVVKFARNDSFWKTNFLSAKKLRKPDSSGVMYYDVFLTKMREKTNERQKGTFAPNRGTTDELAEIAAKWNSLATTTKMADY